MKSERQPYQDRIVADPTVLAGKPVVRGTRIAVEHVLDQLADCLDTAELFAVFPDLSTQDVQACLAYARALAAGEVLRPSARPGRRAGRAATRPA